MEIVREMRQQCESEWKIRNEKIPNKISIKSSSNANEKTLSLRSHTEVSHALLKIYKSEENYVSCRLFLMGYSFSYWWLFFIHT